MTTAAPFDVDDTVRVDVEVRDPDTGLLVDPAAVTALVRDPDRAETTPEVVQVSTGVYRFEFVVTVAGTWAWKATAVGAPVGVITGTVYVEAF